MTETQLTVHEADAYQGQDAILAMLTNPAQIASIDVDKIQHLLNLREQNEKFNVQRENRQNQADFALAFCALQAALPNIVATKTNSQTKSKYAALEDIHRIIKPILAEHGFSISHRNLQDFVNGKDLYGVETTLLYKNGVERSTSLLMPVDNIGIAGSKNKTDIHGIASTVQYCKRYTECSILDIAITNDLDGNLPPKPWHPAAAMRERLVNAYRDADVKTQNMFIGKYGEPIDGGFDAFFNKCEDAADFQKKLAYIQAGRAIDNVDNS